MCSPYEAVLNKMPDNSRIKIFWCATYAHKHHATWKFKLNDRVDVWMYLGTYYGLYWFYSQRRRTTVTKKHATFGDGRFHLDEADIKRHWFQEYEKMEPGRKLDDNDAVTVYNSLEEPYVTVSNAANEDTLNVTQAQQLNEHSIERHNDHSQSEQVNKGRWYPSRDRRSPTRFSINPLACTQAEDKPKPSHAWKEGDFAKWKIATAQECHTLKNEQLDHRRTTGKEHVKASQN